MKKVQVRAPIGDPFWYQSTVYQAMVKEGIKDGMAIGYAEGFTEGFTEGFAKGEVLGAVNSLMQLMKDGLLTPAQTRARLGNLRKKHSDHTAIVDVALKKIGNRE